MAVRAVCPGCHADYHLDERACGQTVRCKYCHQTFEVVPILAEEAPPAATQAQPGTARSRPSASAPGKRKPETVKKSSSSAGWWIAGGVAAAVLFLMLAVGGLGTFIYLRAQAAEEEAAAARRKAEQARFQAKQPFEKVDDWNRRPDQNIAPLPPGVADNIQIVPPGGAIEIRPVEPPAKPAEPPFEPIVIPQPAGPHLNVRPPQLAAERVVRKLPSTVGDVAVGGGGRFLILHLPGDRKLAIFDVNAARIVKYLSFTDDIKFAAGMDKLLVALTDKKVLQRWSLTTFERELSVPLAGEGKIVSLTMGSASNGPLLVQQGNAGLGGGQPALTFHDIRTMKPLTVQWGNNPGGPLDPRAIRASANGKVFGLLGWGPVTLIWDEGRITITHLLQGGGLWVVPGPDGKTVFTDSAIYTEQLKPAPGTAKVRGALPGTHGRYYIAGDSVYLLGDSRPLMTIPIEKPKQEPGAPPILNFNDPLALDKRGCFIPDAKLLVHIPLSNDQLILHRLDIEAGLEKSGIDYLFVNSHPPIKARKGAAYRYQLAVKSKKGGVKYRLESGPKGMKVSATGLLTWDVPANADGEVDVILSISDRAGQEVFHTFRLVPGPEGEEQAPIAANVPPEPVKPPAKPPEPEPEPEPVAPPPVASAIKPPKLDRDRVEVPLPSAVANVAVGGGGRYLFLQLPRERKLAVFDVNEAKIIGHIPLAGDKVFFTAGRTKLIVALSDENVIQRWSLATLKREATAPLPVRDTVSAVVMGSNSEGPLLVASAQGVSRSELFFMDPATLKRLPLERTGQGHIHIQETDAVRASADGQVFTFWRNNSIPQGIQTLVVEGREVKGYYEHNTAGHLLPGPDGKVIYTGSGRYTNQVKRLEDGANARLSCFPAVQGDYYLSLPAQSLRGRGKNERPVLSVHLAGADKPLATLPDIELPSAAEVRSGAGLGLDRRIHFIPAAHLIITLPIAADRLVLHRFDPEAALEKSGIDYLLITSMPPTTAKKGAPFAYKVEVKSKKGGVKSKLESGPPGMKLSSAGVLTWRVPADFDEDRADVLVTVTDASGQEIFQKFTLDCRK